jgi:hypothetical protein
MLRNPRSRHAHLPATDFLHQLLSAQDPRRRCRLDPAVGIFDDALLALSARGDEAGGSR